MVKYFMSLEQSEDFLCPYCGQTNPLSIDFAGGSRQRFVVDCEVCCAPIVVHLKMNGQEILSVEVRKENE